MQPVKFDVSDCVPCTFSKVNEKDFIYQKIDGPIPSEPIDIMSEQNSLDEKITTREDRIVKSNPAA